MRAPRLCAGGANRLVERPYGVVQPLRLRRLRHDMGRLDNYDTLPGITVPTLVVAVEREGSNSAANVRDWQRTIPGSELRVIRGEGYHVAASHPDECAISVLD